jgi:Fe-S-cluster containining protein
MRSTGLLIKKDEKRFECNHCGACCRGRDVPLTLDDIYRLSDFLGMPPDEFFAGYCVEMAKSDNTGVLPFLRADGGECCFLEDNICQVHFVKPTVCEYMPSAIFGGLKNARARMPPSCAIQHTRLESSSDDRRLRKNYVNAVTLTTIYYSQHGTFKYELAKPFIYRIMLFKKSRKQLYKLMDEKVNSN